MLAMMNDPDLSPRHALGAFLRARRGQLAPSQFGIAAGTRRRTPGLRREEVAQVCGISTTWLTWLEQGREISVSPASLARIARGLGFSTAERAYLFQLAGRHDPEAGREMPVIDGLEIVQRSLDGMVYPAYVLDRCWSACAWNGAARHLFTGWLDEGSDRNQLRYLFLNPTAKSLIADWEIRARRVLAEFRADSSRHLDDPALRSLIAELTNQSGFFAQAWDSQSVLGRDGGERRFNHTTDGELRFDQMTFTLARNPDLKLVMLVG